MAGPPWKPAPTRWQLQHFKEQPLTRGVEGELVKIYFAGQVPIENIPVEHARWFAALAGQLRVEQVRRAFEAAGAAATDAEGFAARVIEKIEELRTALGTTAAFVR